MTTIAPLPSGADKLLEGLDEAMEMVRTSLYSSYYIISPPLIPPFRSAPFSIPAS
jgi:hypothetical protein